MKPVYAVAVLVVFGLSACGKSGGDSDQGPARTPVACQAQVDLTSGAQSAFVEDIVDGGAGTFKLVDLRSYAQVTDKQLSGHLGAHAQFSKSANPKVMDLDGRTSVLCSDVSQIPEGQISLNAKFPLAFSRNDGKFPLDLKYFVKTSFQLYGAKATSLDQKEWESFQAEQMSSYDPDSIAKTDSSTSTKRSFYRLSDGKVAVKLDQQSETVHLVVIGIYELVN
jgi:hypothetical protein